MKVVIDHNDYLCICPETDFEANVLSKFHNPEATLVTGVSLSDIDCIRIKPNQKKE